MKITKRIVMIGPPGSGKGTQATLLKTYGYHHLSTGQLIREGAEKGDPEILEFMEKIKSGDFAPDEFIMKIVAKHAARYDKIIFDGVPRNTVQAEYMDAHIPVDIVLNLELSTEVAMQRVAARFNCESCKKTYTSPPPEKCACGGELHQRDEDTTVERRLKRREKYIKDTLPALEVFRKKGLVKDIDAGQSVEEVGRQIKQALNLE